MYRILFERMNIVCNMPVYKRLSIAQLRLMCDERGIEHAGLRKAALIDLLRQDDLRNGQIIEGIAGEIKGTEDVERDGEVILGESVTDRGCALSDVNAGENIILTQESGTDSESVKALRLRLAVVHEEKR